MRKTAMVFVVLLALCLAMGACSKQAEVEKRSDAIPQPAAEQAPDAAIPETTLTTDSAMVDTTGTDTTRATQ